MRFNIGKDILPHEFNGAIYNHESASRLTVVRKIFFLVFIVFIARTVQLSLQTNECKERSSGNNSQIETRADIIDRNGVVLAKTVKNATIKLYPPRVKEKDVDEVAYIIHDLLPVDYSVSDALRKIRSNSQGIILKTNADDGDIKKINDVNKKYDCFEVKYDLERRYPQKNIFAHVVGVAGEKGGLEGAELMFDKQLRENKDPLRLSIDSRVQNIFHEQLSIAMNKYKANGAIGMLMNSATGEMIAMVQLPDFNPNNIKSVPRERLKFKAMRDNFEMGSIFKIFNTALAYEHHLENNIYDVSKPYPIKDKFGHTVHSIKDINSFYRDIKKGKKSPKMKVPEIMLYSCNTGSAQIALDLPNGTQKEFFERLHFNRPVKLDDWKTETALTQKVWGPVEKATASFGHGIEVTPMHLLLGVNAMTNGGIYIYPTLLKRSIGAIRGERIIDSEISAKLRDIMFHVAEETTAQKARVKGIDIGGKTGTAEKRHSDGTTDRTRNMAVFAGIFPVSAPQYVILVMLDEPKGLQEDGYWKTASYNAVPTAGAILDGIMPLLFE